MRSENLGESRDMQKGTCLRVMQLQVGGDVCAASGDRIRDRKNVVSATAIVRQVNL